MYAVSNTMGVTDCSYTINYVMITLNLYKTCKKQCLNCQKAVIVLITPIVNLQNFTIIFLQLLPTDLTIFDIHSNPVA